MDKSVVGCKWLFWLLVVLRRLPLKEETIRDTSSSPPSVSFFCWISFIRTHTNTLSGCFLRTSPSHVDFHNTIIIFTGLLSLTLTPPFYRIIFKACWDFINICDSALSPLTYFTIFVLHTFWQPQCMCIPYMFLCCLSHLFFVVFRISTTWSRVCTLCWSACLWILIWPSVWQIGHV